ncbi:YciI family protein [Mucilaginibacter ginsenosidivorans]|uniref:Transcription initiation protein n=1 Tax=Mucilaginibacter ginsenosidivorans TaxID=398053 RepID=A0A5B8UYX0_9SPHI|nr:YciI family protein [Mucilaginibacter ginsenosidivorans]QEC64219.1 transcription initiation protein [Mucilaginibacter ginsenosidivorans]
MKEFVLIFRLEELPETNFSPEEMQARMGVWEKWVDGIIAQNILVSRGNRLSKESRVVRDKKLLTKGPYVELSEIIGGYIIIRANSIDEAAEIVKEAPIVGKGTIEVRGIYEGDE